LQLGFHDRLGLRAIIPSIYESGKVILSKIIAIKKIYKFKAARKWYNPRGFNETIFYIILYCLIVLHKVFLFDYYKLVTMVITISWLVQMMGGGRGFPSSALKWSLVRKAFIFRSLRGYYTLDL